MNPEEVTRIIVEGRGQHFDPQVVDAFLDLQAQFAEIAGQLADVA